MNAVRGSKATSTTVVAMITLVFLMLVPDTNAFQTLTPFIQHGCSQHYSHCGFAVHCRRSDTRLSLSQEGNDDKYSRKVRLREEVENPFRKVRFFFYIASAGSAMTSLLVSMSRVAAAMGGINEDLLQESLVNAGVDVAGLIVIGFLWQRDSKAQESRLKRAAKGAELAKLVIRGSTNLLGPSDGTAAETTTRSLSSLRRGRGIEKRVVIAAAGKDMIQQVLEEAASLQDSLVTNDLVVVPVIMPQGIAPNFNSDEDMPDCVALPVGNNWKYVVEDEASEAKEQGVDVEKEGICVVLKKNGRVGQRTRGIFLGRMVGEVTERRELGLDVSNI